MDKKKIEEGVRFNFRRYRRRHKPRRTFGNTGPHCQNVRGAGSRLHR